MVASLGHVWEPTARHRVLRCRACGMQSRDPAEVMLSCAEYKRNLNTRGEYRIRHHHGAYGRRPEPLLDTPVDE